MKNKILLSLILIGQTALATDLPNIYIKETQLAIKEQYLRESGYNLKTAKSNYKEAKTLVRDAKAEIKAMKKSEAQSKKTQIASHDFHSGIRDPYYNEPLLAETGIRRVGR
jgi:hypothetical protein